MKRIAIVGGGISGLAAAYELELARKRGADLDWHLYEATGRLGGILDTAIRDGFVLEGGPDGWVSEKPWLRELALELGLGGEIIPSLDATRRTWVYLDGRLQAIPDRMRLMVPNGPEALAAIDSSPLFSPAARQMFHGELTRSTELRAAALDRPGNEHADESMASFVRRHFGQEVLASLGAPLLSGVFGGDVERLSVRAVMPQFVALERDHGSLIAGLGHKAAQRHGKPQQTIFTSLRRGMGSLVDALVATLPPERLHRNTPALSLKREGKLWALRTAPPLPNGKPGKAKRHVHQIVLATSLEPTRTLAQSLVPELDAMLPAEASSATLVCFAWSREQAQTLTLPGGFGFLVPQDSAGIFEPRAAVDLHRAKAAPVPYPSNAGDPQLLAATFVDQKFPERAPEGGRIIRAFFGSGSTEQFAAAPDSSVAAAALAQLRKILGPLPDPDAALTTVRRWPNSLPQYEVGHLERMAQLDAALESVPGLTLLGNSYRGVGMPDLVHDAREAARKLLR